MQLTFSAGVSMLPSPAGLHDESVAHPSVGNGVDADVHAAGGWRKHSKPAGREWQIQDLLLLMLLTAAVRLPWIFMIPISEAPDEGAHLWVINFIYTHWRLPLPADMIANPAAAYYGALSPLGYLPHLTCAVLMPWFNCALAFRFGSLLMGVGAVAASYFIGHELFKRSRLLALAPPLYMVFHPQFVFVNAYSNNDSATCFIASLVIYACLVGVRRGVSQRSALVTGFLCGLLALCKPTSYCLFPVLVFSICFAVWLHERNGKNRLDLLKLFSLRLSTMLSAALLVSMPFFLKNILQFNGDLLGMRIMLDLWWQAYGKPEPLYHWPVINDRNWQYCLLISYFGNF